MSELKTKWYEKNPGETSSGRILILCGGFVGLLMMPAGVVMGFMGVMGVPDGSTVLMTGTALFTAATAGKAYQNKTESKS